MTYINDIFINLNNDYFEFYEWNKKDYIEHIKKIPIIRINNKILRQIINYDVRIDTAFINNYKQKCEKYNNSTFYNYLVLTTESRAIVIFFNANGNILKKSSLIFEDEDNICLMAKKLKITKIPYTIIRKEKENNLTRLQKERKKFLLKNIRKMSENRLKFLYYDCFNKEEGNINTIIATILNELKNNNLDVYYKSDSLFNLIYQQNK